MFARNHGPALVIAVAMGIAISGLSLVSFPVEPPQKPTSVVSETHSASQEGVKPKAERRTYGPCVILEEQDASLPDFRRKALKVRLGGDSSDPDVIREALLEVARKQDADAVIICGYLSEDNYHAGPPAAELEYGRNGKGWSKGSDIPTNGVLTLRAGKQEFYVFSSNYNNISHKNNIIKETLTDDIISQSTLNNRASDALNPRARRPGQTDLERRLEMGDFTNLTLEEARESTDLDSRLGVKYGNMSRSAYEQWTGKRYVEPR